MLFPHFVAATAVVVRDLEHASRADLSAHFQTAMLEASLRSLFSMPDSAAREKLGVLLRALVNGRGADLVGRISPAHSHRWGRRFARAAHHRSESRSHISVGGSVIDQIG